MRIRLLLFSFLSVLVVQGLFWWTESPNSAAKGFALGIGIFYVGWTWQTLRQHTEHREEAQNLILGMIGPAAVLILALVANALGFLQNQWINWEMETGQYLILRDGTYAFVWRPFLALGVQQLGVLLGVASLMEIVRRAMRVEIDPQDETSMATASVRSMVNATEGLMRRHWLAVLGLGTVFGLLSGVGMALFFAIELTIMWLLGKLWLKLFDKKVTSS